METSDVAFIYLHFIHQVTVSKRAWSLQCHGDLCAVHGADLLVFPLWPDLESARYFADRHCPDLEFCEISLRHLLRRHLPSLAKADVPVGLGVAPYPDGIAVPARKLRRDLIGARRAD